MLQYGAKVQLISIFFAEVQIIIEVINRNIAKAYFIWIDPADEKK